MAEDAEGRVKANSAELATQANGDGLVMANGDELVTAKADGSFIAYDDGKVKGKGAFRAFQVGGGE